MSLNILYFNFNEIYTYANSDFNYKCLKCTSYIVIRSKQFLQHNRALVRWNIARRFMCLHNIDLFS